MIDSNTEVGMSEISSVRETSDVSEIGDFKPQLRAAIAINPSSEHIPVICANGITAAMAVPDGGVIAGQASLMHLDGWTWEEMTVKRDAAMHLIFPTVSRGAFAESKRTYDRRLKQLTEYFEQARRYQKSKAAGGANFKRDLAFDAMLPVLEGKVPGINDPRSASGRFRMPSPGPTKRKCASWWPAYASPARPWRV